ncbi:ferredoxin [Candidatus Woesearchaeota archaeon]|nr:ferredoxin [Candidatus Woesearchaeota archaeon]
MEQVTAETEPKKKYLLQHDRPNCIGCAACATVSEKHWEMNADGKSDIIGGKSREDGWQELDLEEVDFEKNLEAAESCPVNVIHVTDKETGKKVI